jgi:hypothetical protein
MDGCPLTGRSGKLTTFSELTSGKLSALGVVPGDGTKVWEKYI